LTAGDGEEDRPADPGYVQQLNADLLAFVRSQK
jgi:hypothetical protein